MGSRRQIRFILTGEQTGGALFIGEVLVPEGGGPPPHIHEREDETYYLLEGNLTVQVGGQILQVSQGDCAHLPRGIVHSFRNTGKGTARMLVTATPAGIEKFFEEAFYPAQGSQERPQAAPELIGRLIAAAARYGNMILPPPHAQISRVKRQSSRR